MALSCLEWNFLWEILWDLIRFFKFFLSWCAFFYLYFFLKDRLILVFLLSASPPATSSSDLTMHQMNVFEAKSAEVFSWGILQNYPSEYWTYYTSFVQNLKNAFECLPPTCKSRSRWTKSTQVTPQVTPVICFAFF